MDEGLKVCVTVVLFRHAIDLGGLHIHKLVYLVEKSNLSIHCIAELAIQRIINKKIIYKYFR